MPLPRPMAALAALAVGLAASCAPGGAGGGAAACGEGRLAGFVATYFETFPSRATQAGRHELDDRLEVLDTPALDGWIETNRRLVAECAPALAPGPAAAGADAELRLDLELALRAARIELHELTALRRPALDPLFWSGIPGRATLFLLIREDRPLDERLAAAKARAAAIPRLTAAAEGALAAGDPAEQAPELFRIAARQTEAAARFYREGLSGAAGADPREAVALAAAGETAAAALDDLARFLAHRAGEATGDFRLGMRYAERFRLVTGVETPLDEVLRETERALAEERRLAADYGRSVWSEVMAGRPAPADDRELLGALFERVGEDRAAGEADFTADYERLVAAAIRFVREHGVVTLPEPLPLRIARSPDYFVGQSVGGVYPAGPWAPPETETLLFLPTPPPAAAPAALDAFFRDFNHHFNVMITPHEFVPGHTLQLVYAARHPRKLRALFADGVYVEGWGTFCERLMLDLGWGGPLDRLAHLKKRLENTARAIVDIRVHAHGMTEAEVLALVRDEALQREQFAANMWRRTMTSAPQLTFYHLGFDQVWSLYSEVRAARGASFDLREFMDEMMAAGPVPVRRYRERMLGGGSGGGGAP